MPLRVLITQALALSAAAAICAAFDRVLWRERVTVFAVRALLRPSSSFRCSIQHVVRDSPDEKVFRSHTCWIIAGVANVATIGNRSVRQRKRQAMGINVMDASGVRNGELAIAERAACSGPFPAAVRLANFGPEAFGYRHLDVRILA